MSVHSILRGALAALALCVALDAAAAVGLIQFSAGDVKIRNAAGQVRAAAKGGSVDEGDTILTAPAASAQLKMADGGIIAVRPDTELKVDTYRYAGKEDGNERAVMSLLKGGFRTITGIIGRTNKQNYTVNTPTATIGIRGTDHEPVVIPAIVGAGQPPAPAGTYDKVNVGQAFIRTPLGEVNIRQNQVGYAAPNQAPQLLPKVPEFFKATPPVKQAQAGQKEDQQKQGEQKQADQKQQSGTSGQSSSGDKPAEGQSTQTAGGGTSSDSGSGTSSTSSASSGTTSEIRSSATVDATPVTASTGSTATTTAVVPTTPTVVASVTTTTAAAQPPAVVQEVKGSSTDTSLTLNLTQQTTTTGSGTTTTISETPAATPTPTQPTTVTPSVASSSYGSILVSQAPANGTTTELEALTFQQQPQTSYVLDANKKLLDINHTGHATTNAQGLARSITDTSVELGGGTAADVFVDDTSTFYIGRQEGGTITITDNSGGVAPITQSLNASSAHWLIGVQPAQTALPGGVGTISNVQNVTGTVHYGLAAATHPSDMQGNLGTLNSAAFFADFSAQTVSGVLGLKFDATSTTAVSKRNFELLAVASNVPIKRGGFEAIAGTSSAPAVACASGDCVNRSYRGTIRGMFGASTGNSSGIGSGLGLTYSFGPEPSSSLVTAFDDLVQGTAILSATGAQASAGTQYSFVDNSNVRHELFYGTLQTGSTTAANFAVARDTFTLTNPAQTLTGPRTNSNYLFDGTGNLVRIYDTPYVVFDHGKNVTATTTGFPAPTPLANAQVSLGGIDAVAADLFADTALGLRMGRWKGGVLNVTDLATGNGYVEELGDRSVHWLVRSAPTSLPVTGVYHYTRVAATQPTDTYGNVGTLDRARLQVDFSRSTVSAGVAITMPTGSSGNLGTQSLSGYFTDVPLASAGFNVSSDPTQNAANTDRLHVNCFGGGCAANQTYGGRIRGGFSTGTTASAADGAYFRYTFVTNYASQAAADAESRVFDDYIDGFVAFKQGSEIVKPSFDITGTGTSAPIKPAGDATIVYAYNYINNNALNSRAEHLYSEGGSYEVDTTGALISAAGGGFDDDQSIAGSAPAGSDVKKVSVTSGTDPFEIAYGYYVKPTVTGKDGGNGSTFTRAVDDTFQWIRGPAVYPFYLSMVTENPSNIATSTKVGYAQLGGVVTNASGTPGTIDSAKLAVNFNAQTVDAAVKVTVPFFSTQATFDAVANRMALEDLGAFWARTNGPLQHNFSASGSKLDVTIGTTTTPAGGNIEGTLMGPRLQGAGFVFDFFDNTSTGPRASGSVVFGNPTYTDASGNQNVPFQPSVLSDYHLGMVTSGMNKTGSFTNVNGGNTLEEYNNFRADLGALPPARVKFEGQSFNNTVIPVLTRFDGVYPFGYGCNNGVCGGVSEIGARYSIDTASSTSAKVLEAGYDASTGMRWGRWGGGIITVGERASGGTGAVPTADGSGTTNALDATVNHWHYLLTGVQSGPVVLPVSGTFNYTMIGATLPTAYTPGQTAAVTGALTSASLTANFTARTVDVAVNVTMPTNDVWAASANAVKILKDTAFSVEKVLSSTTSNLTVTRGGSATNTAGQIVGGFAGQAGQGAGIAYSLNQGGAAGTTVSGVAAFKR